MNNKKAVVVGAGIAGMAMARALSLKGFKVTVIERSDKAVGASIRNFGMVWPVGQPSGLLYESALLSAEIWKTSAAEAGFFADAVGSFHLAYHQDEAQVLQELYDVYHKERNLQLMTPGEVLQKSPATVKEGLLCGLYSPTEVIVDPVEAIAALPAYLKSKFDIDFIWGKAVLEIKDLQVSTSDCAYSADLVMVCSGADFEHLYPDYFKQLPITKCKLQMMRIESQPEGWRIGPALCGGLSLIHYNSFKAAKSLNVLKERFQQELPEYLNWGIHVMVSQNGKGELIIGDSHEYANTFDPFDKQFINTMIIDYLKTFATFKSDKISASWNGIYPKLTNGNAYLFEQVELGVYVFNGLSGAGMTLSFGLSTKLIEEIY